MVRVWVASEGWVVALWGFEARMSAPAGNGSAPRGVLLCGVPPGGWTLFTCVLGGVLLSRTLAGAVPSALSGLASGFGMDTGRFPVAVTTETTRWAVRDDRHLWCGYSVIGPPADPHPRMLACGACVGGWVGCGPYSGRSRLPYHSPPMCVGVLLFVLAY